MGEMVNIWWDLEIDRTCQHAGLADDRLSMRRFSAANQAANVRSDGK